MKPLFVTGNQYKADYLAKMLGIPLDHKKIELDELQSTSLEKIVEHKVRQAYEIARQPVLVEDVGLGFEALGGLPGPFIRYFGDADDGLEKLCRMLDGFDDRRAQAACVFGYFDGEHLELFRGGMSGVVADHPRGENGFGWDQIFCPDGYNGRTRAELNDEQYQTTYLTIKPLMQVCKYLENNLQLANSETDV